MHDSEASAKQISGLIARAREGDQEACDQILRRHMPYLQLLADQSLRSRFQTRVDGSDVVQQTCLEAFQDIAQFRGHTAAELTVWLRRILERNVSNLVRDHTAQKRDVRQETDPQMAADANGSIAWYEPPANGSGPVTRILRGEAALQLADCLSRLPEAQRVAIQMRYIEGLMLAEIAERLAKTLGATAQIIYRGLATLRELLPDELSKL